MKLLKSLAGIAVALLCLFPVCATIVAAQRGQHHEPLGFLKHALTDASAPALTPPQEAQLNDLITAFRAAQSHGPDAALKAAHTAYNSAILNGDLASAQAQSDIIASSIAARSRASSQAGAKFKIEVLNVLKNGGQLEPLRQKLGDDHLLGLIGSLGGGHFGGGRGFGPGFAPPGRNGHEGARPAKPADKN